MNPLTDLQTSWQLVTPEYAEMLLAKNNHNRPLSRPTVSKYRQHMRDGNWKVTGDTVCIASDGTLIDGQHRVTAIAEEGTPQWMLVVSGFCPETFAYLDIGKKRTNADTLATKGYKHYKLLAAASASRKAMESLVIFGDALPNKNLTIKSRNELTTFSVASYVEDHPSITDVAYSMFSDNFSVRWGMRSQIVALFALLYEQSPALCEEWHRLFVKGVGITSEKHPAHALRSRWDRRKASLEGDPRMTAGIAQEFWIAVEAWLLGQDLSIIRNRKITPDIPALIADAERQQNLAAE